ncbi:MAG: hypothetical protein LBT26_11050 [Clostridiales Family XIII bacterium]|nr:hypothetical protein [Clostridiales Family XIII bacterium]
MNRVELPNLEYFDVFDERKNRTLKGHDQEWYGSWRQRMSGCGPTTASNVLRYIAAGVPAQWKKTDATDLMDQVWKHVTPGRGGVNSAAKLRSGMVSYAKLIGLNIQIETLDVPRKRDARPPLSELAGFVNGGLGAGLPVAFLNLHNGAERQLDKWHWVTVTGMDFEPDFSAAAVDIMDNCNLLRVDLGRWLQTTALGGGFVRFNFGSVQN